MKLHGVVLFRNYYQVRLYMNNMESKFGGLHQSNCQVRLFMNNVDGKFGGLFQSNDSLGG